MFKIILFFFLFSENNIKIYVFPFYTIASASTYLDADLLIFKILVLMTISHIKNKPKLKTQTIFNSIDIIIIII